MTDERPSRSAKKRESTALQNLGEELAKLKPAERARLPLTPELVEALTELDRLTNREAVRRQKQYIGRLMREADAGAIREGLEELRG